MVTKRSAAALSDASSRVHSLHGSTRCPRADKERDGLRRSVWASRRRGKKSDGAGTMGAMGWQRFSACGARTVVSPLASHRHRHQFIFVTLTADSPFRCSGRSHSARRGPPPPPALYYVSTAHHGQSAAATTARVHRNKRSHRQLGHPEQMVLAARHSSICTRRSHGKRKT